MEAGFQHLFTIFESTLTSVERCIFEGATECEQSSVPQFSRSSVLAALQQRCGSSGGSSRFLEVCAEVRQQRERSKVQAICVRAVVSSGVLKYWHQLTFCWAQGNPAFSRQGPPGQTPLGGCRVASVVGSRTVAACSNASRKWRHSWNRRSSGAA